MISKSQFHKKIYAHYATARRPLPWRQTRDPYKILVSEIMLQQTQSARVIPKYRAFIKTFPTASKLAGASTRDVLLLWQGLGYNRRALSLHRAAQMITTTYENHFPKTYDELVTLPGVGPYIAGAVLAFAYNMPVVFIETNIRTVFIHFFFADSHTVTDKELLPYIEKYLDRDNPKVWYNALMDYGAYLKKTYPNPSRKSAHHTKQSSFKGSIRQVRGAIIRTYTKHPHVTKSTLVRILPYDKKVVEKEFIRLRTEGFFT